jgi:hypothetical protein
LGASQPGEPTAPLPLSYVLPLRWSTDEDWSELESYLRRLAPSVAEVIVVDGCEPGLFERHVAALRDLARVVAPDPELHFAMGKVNGVTSGVLAARSERVVIADDDVRYDAEALRRVAQLLDDAEVVRPQNFFDPLPWHARLDTGRALLNRVHTGDREFPVGDFPGTLGVRRSAFVATGGYDGDVIFENLELMRTVAAAGGRVLTPLGLYVRRLPPSAAHFRSQRIRQAYDDLGIPARLAAELAVLPLAGLALATGRRRALASGAALIATAAELGRRRAGGRRHFPATSSLLAPVWLAERGISVWLALLSRALRGGIPYAGRIVPRAVTPMVVLRRRLGGRIVQERLDDGLALGGEGVRVAVSSRGTEPGDLVGPVAERMDPRAPAAAHGDRPPA